MVQDRAMVKVCHLYSASMNYYTSEALNIDHTVFYTANTPCRLYRVVCLRAPRQSYSCNGGLIESHTWSIEPHHFQ